MDETFVHQGITFTWNDSKAKSNRSRHGIEFSLAVEAFFDPFLVVEDATKSASETRQAVIGLTIDWQLLFVVFAETDTGIRIISARPVTAAERKRYEDQ